MILTSTDQRIKHEARLYQAERADADKRHQAEVEQIDKRRLERLRTMLNDEVANMLGRAMDADARITKRTLISLAAPWLHGKTFEQTYRDYSEPEKERRTRERIDALLLLCGGDKKLLISEYARVLDRAFVIPGGRFAWNPQLVRAEDGKTTMIYKWRRLKRVSPTNE